MKKTMWALVVVAALLALGCEGSHNPVGPELPCADRVVDDGKPLELARCAPED